jgi:hypothetical protein
LSLIFPFNTSMIAPLWNQCRVFRAQKAGDGKI